MADAFPIRNLYNILLFSAGAATTITNYQGIDNLEKLKLLHNNDCENLCKSICHPGVTIVGQCGMEIPNPRITFSLRAALNLTLTTYYLWHLDKTPRTIGAENATFLVVRLIISLKERQEVH